MSTYLDRYLAGEHEQVWAELQALGARVRDEPLFSDAFAVAHEAMRRVRRDIELLIPRLEALGYQFYAHPTEYEDGDPPRLGTPGEETRAQLDEIEREFGPLPISLRAFYEVVGAVNLVGEPPEEGEGWRDGTDLDPLLIYGLWTTYADWLEVRDDETQRAAYRPLLFPDFLLKYDYGGVGPISIKAPSADMDAPLMFEGAEMGVVEGKLLLFVHYLRFAILERGGFPGWGMSSWDESPISEEVRLQLVDGLLPF